MPRKGPAPKRPVVNDPVYGAPIVSQLVNKILVDGKKSLAESIVYNALRGVEAKNGQDAVATLSMKAYYYEHCLPEYHKTVVIVDIISNNRVRQKYYKNVIFINLKLAHCHGCAVLIGLVYPESAETISGTGSLACNDTDTSADYPPNTFS